MSSGRSAQPRRRGVLLAVVLLGAGFCSGWTASHKLTIAPGFAALRQRSLANRGDAPPAIRARILETLAAFQTAYTHRDPTALPDLMHRCFDAQQSVLLIGTDSSEWVNGYEPVSRFIANDWTNWGNVSLEVADAEIFASGATAWLATVGTVSFGHATRPLRFTAVMSDVRERWVFRQLQFQWDERPLQLVDLLRPTTLAKLRWR